MLFWVVGILAVMGFEAASADSGSLHLFVNPSARRIDWSTPRGLLWSTIRSTVASKMDTTVGARETALGHVVVHYNCTDLDGVRQTGWVGMTGQNDAEVDDQDLFKKQLGMGLLFKLYADGQLVDDRTSREQVALNPGRAEWEGLSRRRLLPKFLRVGISEEQCSEIRDYVALYRSRSYDGSVPLREWRRRGPDQILYYGFPIREPLENFRRVRSGERGVPVGGGCTAYGVSFLKLLDRHTPQLERFFTRRFEVSEALIGRRDRASGERYRVSVFDILLGRVGVAWRHRGVENRLLDIYDPQRMWDFIDGVQSCAQRLGWSPRDRSGTFRRSCTPELLEWVEANAHQIHADEELVIESEALGVRQGGSGSADKRSFRVVRHGISLD